MHLNTKIFSLYSTNLRQWTLDIAKYALNILKIDLERLMSCIHVMLTSLKTLFRHSPSHCALLT